MSSLPIGFILTLAAIFFSFQPNTFHLFVNYHSIVLVVFGTFGILLFTTPMGTLKTLWSASWDLFRRDHDLSDHIRELKELAETRTTHSENSLIKYAMELWAQGVSPNFFISLLSQKRESQDQQYTKAIQALKNLAKYPPALGMTGTVIGLVSLFANLGVDNKASIGPSLALAMTATFFGLIMANGLVMPLSDRLIVHQIKVQEYNNEIYQILIMINHNEPVTLIEDEVKYRAAA